ncbi:MAG: MMPL family transporter [Lachnospiraceae bacterium]|nr:MMPL family transporter [Lachnospiraceae bacterium]
MNEGQEKKENSFMIKIATFIVDKRNLFFVLYVFAIIFCLIAKDWVKVENDITVYLPETTETRQGLDVMNREFVTYGTAEVMIDHISYEHAGKLAMQIEGITGVTSVTFDDTPEHYKEASAMLSITFDGETTDDISVQAMREIKAKLADYDTYISSEVDNDSAASLAKEMQVVIAVAALIIVAVLLFTSHAYAEVPVLLITFIVAAVLNMGTNFLLGKISFISDSVTVVLQLALAIDYAIILCHRFTEEKESLPVREAAIVALSKAIPEISSSSMTTISGLAALAFMHFKIGQDLAVVLVKAIILSLLSVFTLMPGLLVVFNNLMEKTVHKNLVPKISFIGKFAVKTRYMIPPVFCVIVIVAFYFSNQCPYCFSQGNIESSKQNEQTIARNKIKEKFGSKNLVALVVPAGDYEAEGKILEALEQYDEVDSTLGLSNVEAMDGYVLTDALTPRQFAELTDLDYEVAKLLYSAYSINDENYGEIVKGLDTTKVPLIDMFLFLHEELDKGYVTLDSDMQKSIDDLYEQLHDAQLQLSTEDYSRMLVYLTLPEESQETYDFLEVIRGEIGKYYDDFYIVGNSTSNLDLSSSFATDNIIISVLSALFVIIILFFTFQSAGLPVLLIVVIEGSIFMNFSFPYLENTSLYFLGYLVVSSIQMGANIDYAIVISSRYMELKKEMEPKKAIVESLNQAFPTIITSGAILAAAGVLIGKLSSDGVISSIGTCLGRGTIISIILVMCVLPQILLLGDIIIEKTAFTMKVPDKVQRTSGAIYVDGRVRGYVSGIVDANIHGVIKGDMRAMVDTSDLTPMQEVPESITAIEMQQEIGNTEGIEANENEE